MCVLISWRFAASGKKTTTVQVFFAFRWLLNRAYSRFVRLGTLGGHFAWCWCVFYVTRCSMWLDDEHAYQTVSEYSAYTLYASINVFLPPILQSPIRFNHAITVENKKHNTARVCVWCVCMPDEHILEPTMYIRKLAVACTRAHTNKHTPAAATIEHMYCYTFFVVHWAYEKQRFQSDVCN